MKVSILWSYLTLVLQPYRYFDDLLAILFTYEYYVDIHVGRRFVSALENKLPVRLTGAHNNRCSHYK